MKKSISWTMAILIACILIALSSFTVSASTVTFDKTGNYSFTETVTAEITCSGNERNQAYTLDWTNATGDVVESDTGDTGSCTNFFETFVIPANFGVNITATLTGTNLEGSDTANISLATVNQLLFINIQNKGTFLGRSSSVTATVKDENGKKISGGRCLTYIFDEDNIQILKIVRAELTDGSFHSEWNLDYEKFSEKKSFNTHLQCVCGSSGTVNECIGEGGINATSLENSIGTTSAPFTTSEWLTFREDTLPLKFANGTVYDKKNSFAGFDTIHILTNVTNNNPIDEQLEIELKTFLVNNESKQIFGLPNEGLEGTGFAGLGKGNTSSISNHLISRDAPTGTYLFAAVYNVKFKNQFQVAQYIKISDTFNVTSIKDTFQIANTTADDFFGNEVTVNLSTQSSTILPISNQSVNVIVLSEGFMFDFCFTANNTRDDDINVYIHDIILENPTTGFSANIISETLLGNEQKKILEENAIDTKVCFSTTIPNTVPTHSDYRFHYEFHIGTEDEEFFCGEDCDFEAESDFFYIGKDEDMIPFTKFHTDANSTDLGNPGIYIMTERGEYLTMFDDVNYTKQENIDWYNSTQNCTKKDDSKSFLCDYTIRPAAGEKIKVCMEIRSFYSSEVFIELFDIYLDNDVGDTIIQLKSATKTVENGLKYIGDTDLYLANSSNRGLEGDGNLLDGYNSICTDWLQLPSDIVGGDNWDVQGKARLSKSVYSLKENVVWNWESDEFPIFGLIETQPNWNLHLFDPIHYRIPESWSKVTDTKYIYNFSIPSFGTNAKNFTFGEHVPFRLLDENTPLERVVNITITYIDGSAIPYKNSLSVQSGEIVLFIENVSLSRSDNDFTITVITLDLAQRSTKALEGINGSAGTFDFRISVPDTSKNFVYISGTGRTGQGQRMERDVQITCEVEGFPESQVKFTTYATDTFEFENVRIKVPVTDSIYTMVCSAKDSKFGTFVTDPVRANFKRGEPGSILSGGFVEFIDQGIEAILEALKGGMLMVAAGLVLFLIISRKRKEEENRKGDKDKKEVKW